MILHHFINGTVLESNYFLGNFQNVMEYKKASIAGVICKGLENGMFSTGTEDHETLLDFMALLTVCHTVIPEKHEDGSHKVAKLYLIYFIPCQHSRLDIKIRMKNSYYRSEN